MVGQLENYSTAAKTGSVPECVPHLAGAQLTLVWLATGLPHLSRYPPVISGVEYTQEGRTTVSKALRDKGRYWLVSKIWGTWRRLRRGNVIMALENTNIGSFTLEKK